MYAAANSSGLLKDLKDSLGPLSVQGLTPTQILHVRRAAGRMAGASKKGCNMDLMWALAGKKGDPLYLAAGALRRYAWEWWHASEPSQYGRSRH
eukprot:5055672-Pyramimonas_sp.AAC.1